MHHFLAVSEWSVEKLRQRRIEKLKQALKGKKITVVIDETGDRKKGKTTDDVARQYLGSVGKVDHGIVSVNAYGIYSNITFPWMVKVYKPKGTLKAGDKYKTKIEIASEMITALVEEGFEIELVLADSLYGESREFLSKLEAYNLAYVVAISRNHAVWLPVGQRVRANQWCEFERTFSNQESETRYIREIIYGKKRAVTYWEITTDPETMPENSTSFVMTNLQGKLKQTLGNLYGFRIGVEYGFRQCKQELGWTDDRFTSFQHIERWWEIIFCVYTLISLSSPVFLSLNPSDAIETTEPENRQGTFSNHPQWNHQDGWKNVLNNLRLIVQPL